MKYAKRGLRYVRKGYKNIKKNPVGAASTALTALKIAQKVHRQINSEVFGHKIQLNTNADTTGAVQSLCAISQGDTDGTRTANSIKLARLSGYIVCKSRDAATDTTFVRVVILRGKHERNTAPAWSTTYEAAASGVTLVGAQKLRDRRFDTKVLYDRVIRLENTNDTGSVNPSTKMFKINLKLYGHVNYDGANTTAESGGIYLFFCSNQDTGASKDPAFSTNLTLTYYDN